MKTYKKISEELLTSPVKMLFWVAFVLPVLKNVILGAPMLITSYLKAMYYYSPGSTAITLIYEVILILFQVAGELVFITTMMTLGFYAIKKGGKNSLRYTGVAALFQLGAGFSSVAVYTVVALFGYTDSAETVWVQTVEALLAVFSSWLIWVVILLAVTLLFALLGYLTGRTRLISGRTTPFMLATYGLAAVRTLFSLVDAGSLAMDSYKNGENFFFGCVMPFVYPLIYCGLMLITALLFADSLGRYYYKKRDALKTGQQEKKKK